MSTTNHARSAQSISPPITRNPVSTVNTGSNILSIQIDVGHCAGSSLSHVLQYPSKRINMLILVTCKVSARSARKVPDLQLGEINCNWSLVGTVNAGRTKKNYWWFGQMWGSAQVRCYYMCFNILVIAWRCSILAVHKGSIISKPLGWISWHNEHPRRHPNTFVHDCKVHERIAYRLSADTRLHHRLLSTVEPMTDNFNTNATSMHIFDHYICSSLTMQ